MTKFEKCRTKTVRLDPKFVEFPFFRFLITTNTSDTKGDGKQVQTNENLHVKPYELVLCPLNIKSLHIYARVKWPPLKNNLNCYKQRLILLY